MSDVPLKASMIVIVAVVATAAVVGVSAKPAVLTSGKDENVITLAVSDQREASFTLGDKPVEIFFDSTARDLVNRAREAQVGPPIKLVLENVRADEPPGYQLEVFVGANNPSPARSFLGHLNIYNSYQPVVSFDATEAIDELMTAVDDANLVVTIQSPQGGDVSGDRPAHMTVARARFIAQ